MRPSPARRALALFMCCQPVLWMSDVALAQSLTSPYAAPGGRSATQPSLADDAGPYAAPGSASASQPFQADEPLRATRLQPSEERAGVPSVVAVDAPLDPNTYVCGPGDLLELNLWGIQTLRLRLRLDLEGRAFVERVGYFDLKGTTLAEARRILGGAASRLYPRLQFGLTLLEPRTFRVQVAGAVAQPGSYSARAVDRVAAALARAGGPAQGASRRRVEIRRTDGRKLEADLLLFAQTGDVRHNPFLLDGDVIHVPFERVVVTANGAVNRPGRHELVESRNLGELLRIADGLSPAATRALPISVVRRTAADTQEQRLVRYDDPGAMDFELQSDDIVIFPSFPELQRSMMVLGAVGTASTPDEPATTRRVPYVEGDTVRTLLERLGGVSHLADLENSYVLRGEAAIPLDLRALVTLRDFSADRPLRLGDTLVVPFKRRSIAVEGAVFKPGIFPYNPTYRVEQYVSLAGGPNRFARGRDSIRIVGPDGKMVRYERNLAIEAGSTLVVPERSFTRSELVGIGLTAVGIALSGVAVIISARANR